jgi:hypothetical protein
MAFGANQHGQLGHGSVFEAKSSTLVSNLQGGRNFEGVPKEEAVARKGSGGCTRSDTTITMNYVFWKDKFGPNELVVITEKINLEPLSTSNRFLLPQKYQRFQYISAKFCRDLSRHM